MEDTNIKENMLSVLLKISSSWKTLLNFWVLCSGLMLILLIFIIGVVLAFRLLKPFLKNVSITMTKNGAYIFEMDNKRAIQWLYSASSKPYPFNSVERAERIWSNSGIKVNKGDTLKLVVSGAVCLAIHHLVESAKIDRPPYLHWFGPDGATDEQKTFFRKSDKYRQEKLIAKGERQGMLLMQTVPPGDKPKIIPDSENLYPIGSGKDGPFRIRRSGTLYFAINEVPLSADMHDYYVITSAIDPNYVKKHPVNEQEKAWSEIVKNEYWDLWFDDNVGSFLIVAEIE